MKSTHILAAICCLLISSVATLFAQASGDYRSIASGNWSNTATWQRYNGSSWVAAPSAPTGTGVITVQSADSVFIDAAVSVTGTLKNQGKLGGAGSLTVASGGTYEHAEINGSIPLCTWATGSTCKVTGYISGSKPNNANQDFYNFVWSCVGQTANVDMGMSGNTIGGNFTVDTSGASNRIYLTNPAAALAPITINGDVIVHGGQFASNGSGTSGTIDVTVKGNIVVTGGNFSVSRGSGPDATVTLWGDLSVSNAIVQNSGGTHINKILFGGNRTHNLTLTNVAYGGGTSYFTMEVQSGSVLNMGTTVISASNSGSFILQGGASLVTGDPGGVSGAILCTGASNGGGNSFSTAATYRFNGTVAQVTSTLMPATVDTLTISNPAGVQLTQATTITRRLRLRSGVFDNTVPFTLGPGASISYEGGSLLHPVTSVDGDATIPQTFYVDQNYPNPFNPTTTIKFGLPGESFVSAKVFNVLGQEVATLFEGHKDAGVHALTVDAQKLSSGVYFYRIQANNSVDVKRMVLMK